MDSRGIKIEYSLLKDDVYSVLKLTRTSKTEKNKYIYTAVFAVCIIINLISFFNGNKESVSLFIAVMCFLMTAVIWFYPDYNIKKRAEKSGSDRKLKAVFYEDRIEMGDSEENSWTVELKDSQYIINENYIIISAQNGTVTPFPKRDIDSEKLSVIEKYVTSSATEKIKDREVHS